MICGNIDTGVWYDLLNAPMRYGIGGSFRFQLADALGPVGKQSYINGRAGYHRPMIARA